MTSSSYTELAGSFLYLMIMLLVMLPVVIFIVRIAYSEIRSPSQSQSRRVIEINKSVHYKYGVSEMQGKRPYMEDRHTAVGELNGEQTTSFYGVFDGHGGDGAAQYCVDRLCTNVSKEPCLLEKPAEALVNGFLRTDSEYLEIANRTCRDDGTTAVAMFVHGDRIFVANAGDSRAVLVQKGARTVALSNDHKPNRPDEKKRVSDLGGAVVFWGVWRVEGVLAVSRAIGDRLLKTYVTSLPEVQEWHRTPQDCFVILASDGVWDTLSNEETARIALDAADPQTASRFIMEEAYSRGSADNICVMVIDLRQSSS